MDSDSDFYGDEETVAALHSRVESFDLAAWWSKQHHSSTARASLPTPKESSAALEAQPCVTTENDNNHPCNSGTRQPSESVAAFLARLPPATTDWQPGLDWIYISNPNSRGRSHNATTESSSSPSRLLEHFCQGGQERLSLLSKFAAGASTSGMPQFVVQRDLAQERRSAVADLLELAAACGVVEGKWMLFPEPGRVNEVWAKVARATAADELGVAAKVETRVTVGKERLICVYTRDFRDKDDVARVLGRLAQLELVRPGGRQIYYKTDAWTHLGIYGGNTWGIGASMYSSNEIFAYIKNADSRRP